MSRPRHFLYLIIFLTVFSLYFNLPQDIRFRALYLPRFKLDFQLGDRHIKRDFEFKKGLDLSGGLQVTLLADMSQIDAPLRQDALESARLVIARRVDLYGVGEASIKTALVNDQYRLLVELPGVVDSSQALNLIGQTAYLVFATPVFETDPASPSAAPRLKNFIPSDLTGTDLESARITFETQDRQPAVALKFKDSGKEKFSKLTQAFLNKPIAIMLDGLILSAPIVQVQIDSGEAIITGQFTRQEAGSLATQLNAGALPVPITVISQKSLSATLGEDSLVQSLRAGSLGLGALALFMIIYYRYLGFIAVVSLVIYGLITATLYRLIPVTLTLPGIAGFLLSIGMAVDSNILIFERYREELRAGRSGNVALEMAFGRAWTSIKDANLATIITGLILFNPLDWSFLNTSGAVRGFAFTLLLGILISLFTGIVVTRTLLRLFYKSSNNHAKP